MGSEVTISTDRGSLRYPVVVDPTMVEGVVWVPSRAPDKWVGAKLAAAPGDLVTVEPLELEVAP